MLENKEDRGNVIVGAEIVPPLAISVVITWTRLSWDWWDQVQIEASKEYYEIVVLFYPILSMALVQVH